MSEEERETKATSEELDALLSARRDGALEADDAARLEAMLAASERARLRAGELARVDDLLRTLAADPIPEARLDRIEAALGRRLAAAATLPRAAGGPVAPIGANERRAADADSRARRAPRRRYLGLGLAAALAAGVVLATVVWAPREKEAVVEADELAALGRELGLEEASDLEVIEELELLEFLAGRERDTGEPQG